MEADTPGNALDEQWEWLEVATERLAVARRWTPFFLAGAVTNSLLCIGVLSQRARIDLLAVWALLHAATAAVVGISLLRARTPDQRTSSGLPRSTLLGAGLIGTLWGAPVWLDGTAGQIELLQWQAGAFLLVTSFGAVAFLEGAGGISRNILVSAWLTYGVGLVVAGNVRLGIASLGLLLLVAIGSHLRRELSDRMLELQTESQRQQREATWAAEHDALSGVRNRLGLRAALDAPGREASHFVMVVSLNRFSAVNNEHGHHVGDTIIREAAQRMDRLVGDDIVVARINGDEFAVVMPGRDRAEAVALADEIVARIADPFYRADEEIIVTASVGVTHALGRPVDMSRALREADTALRHSRRPETAPVTMFDRSMEERLVSRIELETDLHGALRNGEIEVWGQPIVNLESQEVTHIEMVARWIRPDGRRVPPSVFVPLAEQLGMSGALTDHMIRGAAEALERCRDHLWLRNANVIVNARVEEVARREMLPALEETLDAYNIGAGRLVVGIKGASQATPEQLRPLLESLQDLGVGFGIDDLGSGHSALAGLAAGAGGVVRLEKSLVRSAASSSMQGSLITVLNNIGRDMGFDVVAEGVEHNETAVLLLELGVTHAQGFLFARAMPIDRLTSDQTANSIEDALRAVHDARTDTSGLVTPSTDGSATQLRS